MVGAPRGRAPCRSLANRYPRSVRVLRTALIVLLVVGMNPGLVELLQDGVHLAVDGRTDHAEDADPCSEHGCAPTGHHCDCCTTMQVVTEPSLGDVPEALPRAQRWQRLVPEPGPIGVRRGLLRPPTA